MKINLDNKVIWVIGASSGIGCALAGKLSHYNSEIIISSRNSAKLNDLSDRYQNMTSLPLDLSNNEQIISAVTDAYNLFGRIDIVIFCAGLSQRSNAENTPLDNTRAIMETNFFSTVTIAKELLPLMKSNGGGRFVILSSIMGRFGAKQRSTYSASKHALHGYFESLRAEEWNNNIRVSIAIIGYVNTEFSMNALTETGENYDRIDPGQRGGMPPELCATKIIQGIQEDKEEILIGGPEKYSTFLKRFAPTLLSKILRNKTIN